MDEPLAYNESRRRGSDSIGWMTQLLCLAGGMLMCLVGAMFTADTAASQQPNDWQVLLVVVISGAVFMTGLYIRRNKTDILSLILGPLFISGSAGYGLATVLIRLTPLSLSYILFGGLMATAAVVFTDLMMREVRADMNWSVVSRRLRKGNTGQAIVMAVVVLVAVVWLTSGWAAGITVLLAVLFCLWTVFTISRGLELDKSFANIAYAAPAVFCDPVLYLVRLVRYYGQSPDHGHERLD